MTPTILSLVIVAWVIIRKLPDNPSDIQSLEAIWTFVGIGGIVALIVIMIFNEVHSPFNIDKLLKKI
jgi:hypothetical protein